MSAHLANKQPSNAAMGAANIVIRYDPAHHYPHPRCKGGTGEQPWYPITTYKEQHHGRQGEVHQDQES